MEVIEEGQLEGDFNGFEDEKVIFQFFGGNKWQQAEYKYNYYYSYMPRAKVIEEFGVYYLEVEGMSDKVRVEKVY